MTYHNQNDRRAMHLERINNFNFINATYSANPTGVLAALEYLNSWKGRKAIIMPCLIELGSASKNLHYNIGKKIGEICDLAIITSGDQYEALQEGMKSSVKGTKMIQSDNVLVIKDMLKEFKEEGSVVLLEGRINEKILKAIKGNQ